VNGTIGDGRPVTRARTATEIRLRSCAAVGGGKASKGSRRIVRTPFRSGRNTVNPRIGSGLKYGRRVEEEQAVEVVRNHGDGPRMGMAFPSRRTNEAERRRSAEIVRETDSPAGTMEGRSLDNPMRGNPALEPGRKDRNASAMAPRSGGSRASERK